MALLTTTNPTGLAITPADVSETYLRFLTAASVGLSSGMRVITTDRDSVVLPRLTKDADVSWGGRGCRDPEERP